MIDKIDRYGGWKSKIDMINMEDMRDRWVERYDRYHK